MHTCVFLERGSELSTGSMAPSVSRPGSRSLFHFVHCTAPRPPNSVHTFPSGAQQVVTSRSGGEETEPRLSFSGAWSGVHLMTGSGLRLLNAPVPTLGEHGPISHHGRRHVGRTTTLWIATAADTEERRRSPGRSSDAGAGLSARRLRAPPPAPGTAPFPKPCPLA